MWSARFHHHQKKRGDKKGWKSGHKDTGRVQEVLLKFVSHVL